MLCNLKFPNRNPQNISRPTHRTVSFESVEEALAIVTSVRGRKPAIESNAGTTDFERLYMTTNYKCADEPMD
jgi:hypothetical protein